MEPLATEPLVVLASASPIVGELLGEDRISVRHSATGYASGPPQNVGTAHRASTATRRSLTDPWLAASTDATLELRASRTQPLRGKVGVERSQSGRSHKDRREHALSRRPLMLPIAKEQRRCWREPSALLLMPHKAGAVGPSQD